MRITISGVMSGMVSVLELTNVSGFVAGDKPELNRPLITGNGGQICHSLTSMRTPTLLNLSQPEGSNMHQPLLSVQEQPLGHFHQFGNRIEQLLERKQLLAPHILALQNNGFTHFSPGHAALTEFAQYYQRIAQSETGYVLIPEDDPICKAMVELANALHGIPKFSHCSVQITQWDKGVAAQPWHHDSPDDKMVWVLTGHGEPTWFLDKDTSDTCCQIVEDDGVAGVMYDCELATSQVQKAKLGQFLVFYGGQLDNNDYHGLIHKGPGTLESGFRRGTVRAAFY